MSATQPCGRADATVRSLLADPSSPLDPHVKRCEECAQVVRDVLAFDRSLGAAAAALVVEQLPPAYRLIGGRARDTSSDVRPRRGIRRFARPLGVVGTVAVVVASTALVLNAGSLRHGVTGSPSDGAPTPVVSAVASAFRPSPIVTTPSPAAATCSEAFGVWVKVWGASGMPDYRGASPIRGAEHDAAVAAFNSCSLTELQAANAGVMVQHRRSSGSVTAPLLETFRKTVPVWCVTDKLMIGTRVCEAEAALGTAPAFYVIRPGDTLTEISAKVGVSLDSILAENPQIDNPDRIMAGDVLILPFGSPGWASNPPSQSASP